MVCITDLQGPSLISLYPMSSFYSPVGTLTPPMQIFLSSVHCLLFPALPEVPIVSPGPYSFHLSTATCLCPLQSPAWTPSLRILHWATSSVSFIPRLQDSMNFEVDCCIFVGMLFYRNVQPSFPTAVLLSCIGGNKCISCSFSVSCCAWLNTLNSAGFELMLLIDWLKCLTQSKQSKPLYSASLVGGQLERDGCSVLGPVASVVG